VNRAKLRDMRMAQTIVFVEDIARMQAFYQGALGLPVISAEPGWVRLDAGGVVLALHAIKPGPPLPEPARERADAYIKLCFHVDDIDDARAALVAAGSTMRELHHHGDVAFCDGLDPEGNIFQITTR
jgi:catechol 2,3-dioxygenase-like lactoylglutathione lyase family enzyme